MCLRYTRVYDTHVFKTQVVMTHTCLRHTRVYDTYVFKTHTFLWQTHV
jgi:hypothetical protein